MNNFPITDTPAPRKDVPQQRLCLRCRAEFWSEGFNERICRRCKGSSFWRNAVPTALSTRR